MVKMKLGTCLNLLVIYSAVMIVSSAPVKDAQENESRRHNLSKDKESLLKRLQDLQNEVNGRRSNEELNLKRDDSSNKREESARSEVKASTILSSTLKRGSVQKAVEDPEVPSDDNEITDYEPYKEALKHLLDEEIERGHFVDQPFDDNDVGQVTVDGVDKVEIGDTELKSMFDDLDIDDLKQLLEAIKQNKQATEEEGEEDDNKIEEEVEEEEEDETGGFLQDISVDELQKLADDIRAKNKDGLWTEEELQEATEEFVSRLSTRDLQKILAALKEKNQLVSSASSEEMEEGGMTDEELNDAIAALVSHINTADLHRILAAIRARKQEESGEDSGSSSSSKDESEGSSSSEEDSSVDGDTSNDRDTERHVSEEKVMSSLMDFLAGLSTEDLKKTLKAVQMKKLAMKDAAEKVASEYLGNEANNVEKDEEASEEEDEEEDEEEGDSSDNTSSSSSEKEPGPCAIEKQTVLESIEGARLNGTPLLGAEVPNCDEDGFYDALQCSGSMCYCVDKLGAATEGETTLWEVETLKCNQEQDEPTKIATTDDAKNEEGDGEDGEEVDEDAEDEDAEGEEKLEQVERDLLEMLKQQKRQQMNNELLNM